MRAKKFSMTVHQIIIFFNRIMGFSSLNILIKVNSMLVKNDS